MATQILASGTTAASSADQTVASGASVSIIQRGRGRANIEAKHTTGYVEIGFIDDHRPVASVDGPLVFRVSRPVTPVALAVDIET